MGLSWEELWGDLAKVIIVIHKLRLEMTAMAITEITGGQTRDVRYTGAAIDFPSDLEWVGNRKLRARYRGGGLSSKSRRNLRLWRNQGPSEIEAYKVSRGVGDIIRKHQGKEKRTFKQFRGKTQWGGAENGFP